METFKTGASLKQEVVLSLSLSLEEILNAKKRNGLHRKEIQTLETDSVTNKNQTLHDDKDHKSEVNNEKNQGSNHKYPKRRKFKPKVIQDQGTRSNKTPISNSQCSNPRFSPQTPKSTMLEVPVTSDPKLVNSKGSPNSDPKSNNSGKSKDSVILDLVTPTKTDIVYVRRNKRTLNMTYKEKGKNDIICVEVYNKERTDTFTKIDVEGTRVGTSSKFCNAGESVPKHVRRKLNFGEEPGTNESLIRTNQNCGNMVKENESVGFVSEDIEKLTLNEIIRLLRAEKKMKKIKMKNLNIDSDNLAIVPHEEKKSPAKDKEKKHKPKVLFDDKTNEEWNKIIGNKEQGASSSSGENSGNEKFWRTEREKFSKLADGFNTIMELVQGDRRFSEWNGSVMDSVVGAFLTQNVSDHLSSSAFISLASAFPSKSRSPWPDKKNADDKWDKARGSDKKNQNPKIFDNKVLRKRKCVPEIARRGYHNGTENIDWDALRRTASQNHHEEEREISIANVKRDDLVNWEDVIKAHVNEVAEAINGRGQGNVLAERIQAFLKRVARDHGSLDLEWLRDVPPAQAKEFLLSIYGLGLKSVECIRLLALHQPAFPVDTNVGRICVRLGWVPIEPLPEELQIHLLELYPMMNWIQRYLWPRLCKLDQKTLYELHYQMITCGKVFCTKSKPNCNACPFRTQCRHYASAFASARLMLPGIDENSADEGTIQLSESSKTKAEPIIEEPSSPDRETNEENREPYTDNIEDIFIDDPDEIPTIKLDVEAFVERLEEFTSKHNDRVREIDIEDISRALVIPPVQASMLKNQGSLRTVHDVYEIPDGHPVLKWLNFEERNKNDPSHYLLIIWTPEPDGHKRCENCVDFVPLSEEEKNEYVEGSILMPCRTAMRGSFPLNGTYFQINEVFADHGTSRNPVRISRDEIRGLTKLRCYCGSSVSTVLQGLSTSEIQFCFWRGVVCIRGFDRETRRPKPLSCWLHKMSRNRKTSV